MTNKINAVKVIPLRDGSGLNLGIFSDKKGVTEEVEASLNNDLIFIPLSDKKYIGKQNIFRLSSKHCEEVQKQTQIGQTLIGQTVIINGIAGILLGKPIVASTKNAKFQPAKPKKKRGRPRIPRISS